MQARAVSLRRTHKGFTLVEMLVVIAIMVALASLALPALMKARESAAATKCASNLRQLGLGLQQFADVEGHYLPYRWENNEQKNRFGVDRPRWQWILSDYVGRPAQNPDEVKKCLTAAPPYVPLDTTCTQVPLDNEIFTCPSLADNKSIRSGAYGYNFMYLGNSRNLVDGDAATPYINYPVRPVKDPARTIAFADSRGGNTPHGAHSMTLDAPHMRVRPAGTGNVNSPSPKTATGFDPYGPDETGSDIVLFFSPAEIRHNGRAIVVFVDGHVERLTLEQMGYVVSNGIAQDQPVSGSTATYPWGSNALWTGVGLDETSPNFSNVP